MGTATSRQHTAWEGWQATPISQRLLPVEVRQQGYTVLRVPPKLREVFCLVARIFTDYDRRIQKRKRVLSSEQLAAFLAWHEATQALLTALRKEDA